MNMKKAYVTKAEYELGYARLGIKFAAVLIIVKTLIAIICGYDIVEYAVTSFGTIFLLTAISGTLILLSCVTSGRYIVRKYIVIRKGVCKTGQIVGKELKRGFGVYDTYTFAISVKDSNSDEVLRFKSVPYMARKITYLSSVQYCDVYCYKGKYILDNFRAEDRS